MYKYITYITVTDFMVKTFRNRPIYWRHFSVIKNYKTGQKATFAFLKVGENSRERSIQRKLSNLN